MALATGETLENGQVRDSNGYQVVKTAASAGSADVAGTLTDGRKTVAAAGTAVVLRASLACKWVTVSAFTTNTTIVAVGGSGALATTGSEAGTLLTAGQSATFPVSNANLLYVDAKTTGEGVSFTVGSA